jgi:hypothetical protein
MKVEEILRRSDLARLLPKKAEQLAARARREPPLKEDKVEWTAPSTTSASASGK